MPPRRPSATGEIGTVGVGVGWWCADHERAARAREGQQARARNGDQRPVAVVFFLLLLLHAHPASSVSVVAQNSHVAVSTR